MLTIFKKNIRPVWIPATTLVGGLLFFSLLSVAQDDERKATIVVDTTIVMEPPADEETDDDIPVAANKYFYKNQDSLLVKQRTIPVDVVKRMKEDDDFWYANAAVKKEKTKEGMDYEKEQGENGEKGKKEEAIPEDERKEASYTPLGQRSWFQSVLWFVIIGGFAIVLVMYLSSSNIGLFRKKKVKLAADQEEEVITEDIFAINYQKEIDKAAAQGNYRLATRLMFLRLLKNMSEKNIIRYKQDKTNLDYLLELHPTHYYKNFFRVTRNYEYSWYGLFPVSDEAYKVIRNDFDQFEKEVQQG